jgi:hypothetical protein|tara:strand:+ start:1034 stop:1264 length:231 start_codon:yes stop_codon:yes gene_type:complete
MANSIKLKIVAVFIMCGIILWSKTAQTTVEVLPTLLPLPSLNYCSCDSATYCLNDEDVIQLHMWYENAKFFGRSKN